MYDCILCDWHGEKTELEEREDDLGLTKYKKCPNCHGSSKSGEIKPRV